MPTSRLRDLRRPGGDDERQQAEDERNRGHHHGAEPGVRAAFPPASAMGTPLSCSSLANSTMRIAFFAGKRDQHHKADLRVDVEGQPGQIDADEGAQDRRP